jgi:hypothetical protein
MCAMARGITPACVGKPSTEPSCSPSMVCVLPVPVCPYAKMVQLNPDQQGCTDSRGVSDWSHVRPELDLWVALTPGGCQIGFTWTTLAVIIWW